MEASEKTEKISKLIKKIENNIAQLRGYIGTDIFLAGDLGALTGIMKRYTFLDENEKILAQTLAETYDIALEQATAHCGEGSPAPVCIDRTTGFYSEELDAKKYNATNPQE